MLEFDRSIKLNLTLAKYTCYNTIFVFNEDRSKVINKINELKKTLKVTIAAHFYQRDDVFALADLTGDSLELAKLSKEDKNEHLIFCGVGFMGQSVKVLAPNKRVYMPKIACCSMARMIDENSFDNTIQAMNKSGISSDEILPITYINSSAEVKAQVGKMGGLVCTSSNARKIISLKIKEKKKILFLPDRCLGQNIAKDMGLSSAVVGIDTNLKEKDIICYDGFCSVHQLFSVSDIEFYRKRYPDILIAVHPECPTQVADLADFVGSTSQIMSWVSTQDVDQKIAVGTEYNLVNRLRAKNTFVLSSSKPSCPTMNETSLEDVLDVLESIRLGRGKNEIFVDEQTIYYARIALERMLELS